MKKLKTTQNFQIENRIALFDFNFIFVAVILYAIRDKVLVLKLQQGNIFYFASCIWSPLYPNKYE